MKDSEKDLELVINAIYVHKYTHERLSLLMGDLSNDIFKLGRGKKYNWEGTLENLKKEFTKEEYN